MQLHPSPYPIGFFYLPLIYTIPYDDGKMYEDGRASTELVEGVYVFRLFVFGSQSAGVGVYSLYRLCRLENPFTVSTIGFSLDC
jgi:hypothetical protein